MVKRTPRKTPTKPANVGGDSLALASGDALTRLSLLGASTEPAPCEPSRSLPSFMDETNGGGSWETVPGFNASRARNIGLPAYAGPQLNRLPHLENTIGAPDGVPVPDTTDIPYRSICRLDITYANGRVALGTGWFVGRKAIATAGHNLKHPEMGAAIDIKIWPAYNGAIQYDPPTIETLVFPDEWARSGLADYDYGVILLKDERLGNQLGWFGIADYASGPAGLAAQVCGYALNTPLPTQYFNGGRIARWDNDFVYYTFDTEFGMSGSPVFTKRGHSRLVVAIHTTGTPTENSGRRLSSHAYDLLVRANAY